jgi:hypothetical protein
MATQNTTLYSNQRNNNSVYSGGNSATDVHGKVRCISDSYLTTSALTQNSHYIVLGILPAGAKLISAEFIVPAGVGTTAGNLGYYTIANDGTLTVGDVDRWSGATAVTLATAGRKQLMVTGGTDSDYTTTSEVAVVYMPTATDFATAITFTYILQYVVE